ncbi:MAG: PEP-CTERM sorting domain-containing protein [Bryobacteraceae bacterium]|nr:PEP-CTERM sorting domain-containing protein [Bryobacteraceae bacterium]
MKKHLLNAVFAGLALATIMPANTIPLRVSFDGLDFAYDPETGNICDSGGCFFGAGNNDAVDTLNFRINGIVIPTPSALNPRIDLLLNVGALPLNGNAAINPAAFNALDILFNGGALFTEINGGNINITTTCAQGGTLPNCTNNAVTITVLGNSVNLASLGSLLPQELNNLGIQDNTFIPVVLTFSGNFSGPLPLSELGGFSAQGSGELQGTVPEVPEPMTMALMGAGLAGIALLRRRNSR